MNIIKHLNEDNNNNQGQILPIDTFMSVLVQSPILLQIAQEIAAEKMQEMHQLNSLF